MNQLPLVSVICLCHNQLPYVREAIQSVWKQSYPYIELIVVDDGSTDGSKEMIESILKGEGVKFIDIESRIGNCAAFNRGFFQSKGEFIIDLAADDILMPDRILEGINTFMKTNAGVTFCDVMNIDQEGDDLDPHFKNQNGSIQQDIPEGDIYLDLIKRYFISPPSMMIRREVLEELGGYDESLSYEDFDFWIRSSRNWNYAFTNNILVKKRKVMGSLSDHQFRYRTKHQESTLRVCQKIKELNRSKEEDSALRKRCFYEIKQCIKQGNLKLIFHFLKLL
ncbi:glycosyltransferase [Ekhidna sp.]|uniref:glycosyltransferase n=1 Tax=Ekhidna sp. TaxID=2608089 RepID=UPI003C7AE68A